MALLWRLTYVLRLAGTPLASTLRGDELSYWEWASFLVGHGFVGTNPFFQGPLYPYVLALLRAFDLTRPESVLVVQAVWGALGVALLSDAIRRMIGGWYGPAIGCALAVNAMWTFFDGRILTESLLLLLECLLLWVWSLRVQGRSGGLAAAATGLLIGLMAQCRASHLVLMLPFAGFLLVLHSPRRTLALRELLIAAGVVVAVCIPSTVWNWNRTHAFIPFTYNGGLNLYVGNNPRANGTYVWIEDARRLGTVAADAPDGSVSMDGREYLKRSRGLDLSPAQTSEYWQQQAFEYMRDHPLRVLQLAAYKALLMVHHQEIPQIEHLSTYTKLAGPLGAPLVGGFSLLFALAVVGVAGASRARVMSVAVILYVAALLISVLPFFVIDRYRIHLVPGLAVLAALGLARFLVEAQARGWRGLRTPVLCGLSAYALTWGPWSPVDPPYEEWLAVSDEAVRWLEDGKATRAIATFDRAVALEAALVRQRRGQVHNEDRAELHHNHGVARRQVGDRVGAIAEFERAAGLDPTHARYVRTLSDAYYVEGRIRESDSLLVAVRELVGGAAEADMSAGLRAARDGDFTTAARAFESAVGGDARLFGAWGALIRVHLLTGDPSAAQAVLERARSAGMPRLAISAYSGWIAAERGDAVAASRALSELSGAELDPMLSQVVARTRELISAGTAREPR